MSAVAERRIIEVRLGPAQMEILRARDRFLCIEGAMRSAKTWTCLIKVRKMAEEHPGIKIAIARWTQDGLNAKLLPDYRDVCGLMGLTPGEWRTGEQCYWLANGSRVYALHLKTGQTDTKYAAVRGLTVAVLYIDQLEEVPEDVCREAMLRISQPGFPQQFIATPNPVPETHYIARLWPAKGEPVDERRYLRLSLYDNRHNLDAATIRAAETLYPEGHPQHGTKILGRRGLDVQGQPVYSGAFARARHVAQESLTLNPQLPLLEAYDYGFHRPCVVWGQYAPWGHLRIVGGVMGGDLHLDRFLDVVQRYRDLWFPTRPIRGILATCDPAGGAENSQGLRGTPVGLLNDHFMRLHEHEDGDTSRPVQARYQSDANHPERRRAANDLLASYMRVRVNDAEAFLVDPQRWVLAELNDERQDSFFVDALDVGYVYEEKDRHSATLGTYRIAKKDGYYEHSMNCLEYLTQAFVGELPKQGHAAAEAVLRHGRQIERDEARALAARQRDTREPDERPRVRSMFGGQAPVSRGRGAMRRGGYFR